MRSAATHGIRFQGPELIAAGLALLMVGILLPAAPYVTAMAIVTLGATQVTAARFRSTAALLPVLVLHAATYGGLYALFVSAVLHAASSSAAGEIGFATAADLAASIVPMACTLRRIAHCLQVRPDCR